MRSKTLIHIKNKATLVSRAKMLLRRNDGLRAESILEASLACFAEEDYENVTIPLIAKRIGVAHSLIYYYFKSKDALYQSAVLHALHMLMMRYEKLIAEEKNPVSMIVDYLDLNVEMSETLRSLVRIMLANVGNSAVDESRFIDSFVEDFYNIERRVLTDCVQQGIDKGLFACSDAKEFAGFISRNIDGIYYGSFLAHGESIPVAVEYLKSVIFKLLCGADFKLSHCSLNL